MGAGIRNHAEHVAQTPDYGQIIIPLAHQRQGGQFFARRSLPTAIMADEHTLIHHNDAHRVTRFTCLKVVKELPCF